MGFWEPNFWDLLGSGLAVVGFAFAGWQARKARTAADAARAAFTQAVASMLNTQTSAELSACVPVVAQLQDALASQQRDLSLVLIRHLRTLLAAQVARPVFRDQASSAQLGDSLRSLAAIEKALLENRSGAFQRSQSTKQPAQRQLEVSNDSR